LFLPEIQLPSSPHHASIIVHFTIPLACSVRGQTASLKWAASFSAGRVIGAGMMRAFHRMNAARIGCRL